MKERPNATTVIGTAFGERKPQGGAGLRDGCVVEVQQWVTVCEREAPIYEFLDAVLSKGVTSLSASVMDGVLRRPLLTCLRK
jgi:hypothetical protein